MKFTETEVVGAYVIGLEPFADERGGFARLFCETEFANMGLEHRFVQINTSWSSARGTLRGLHYQIAPAEEVKLIRCTRGAIFDVVLDLRAQSPSFGRAVGVELTQDNRLMMYAPGGCAHGYVTLSEDAEIIYPVSTAYAPSCERGVRWDDPSFQLPWPIAPTTVSAKDSQWPDYVMPG